MSLRTKTSEAIQKAGQAVFDANAVIAKSLLEQKDFVLNMRPDLLISTDATNAFKDLQALAALSQGLMGIDEALQAIYAKSLEMSSPQSTVLLGHSQVGHLESNVDATDVQLKVPTIKRGRKPKAVAIDNAINTAKRKPSSVKFKGPNAETWSGQGRPPRWLTALESSGTPRSHWLVKS